MKRYRVIENFRKYPKPLIQVHIIYPTKHIGETMWLADDEEPMTSEEIKQVYTEAATAMQKLADTINALNEENKIHTKS